MITRGSRVRVIRDSKYSKVGWEGQVTCLETKAIANVLWSTGPHAGVNQTVLVKRLALA